MSILSRLKNKLQDPIVHESKFREFDECMSLLKNENVELHKRIDQLEAKYKTNPNIERSQHHLEEHIRQLEGENERLSAENQCQRREYERFLDQLTNMVIRTAVMQENLRQDCASIYHVIEHLSDSKTKTIQNNLSSDAIKEARRKILNNSSKLSNDFNPFSSSSSSLIAHRSIATSESSTQDLLLEERKPEALIPTGDKTQVLHRSETFTVSKKPSEEKSSTLPRRDNPQPPPVRPSRLPFRCPTTSTTSSAPKASKLPVRTTTSLNRQQTSTKKSHIPTPVTSNRSTSSMAYSSIKKPIRSHPSPVIQPVSNNVRSRSLMTTENTPISPPLKQCLPPPSIEIIIQSTDLIEPMKSTSSESSIEEQTSPNKLPPLVQDEGYSTWSSIDVKDESEKPEIDPQQRNIGFIQIWLDTTNKQYLTKPVKEDENEASMDSSSFHCPFIRNRCSNILSLPLASNNISFSNKDISLDSLDSSQSKEQTITSSSSSSASSSSSSSSSSTSLEAFEKLLLTQTLANLTDSASSTSSTFNMSDYIEDHFLDHDDNSSEISSSFETTIIKKMCSLKPQKRLLFPGLLNRLIFFRRFLSESDLQRNQFSANETESQANVYHSNIINEHSVEVNLINTYGSETELHVWSHDCAEQRRFLDERQRKQSEENRSNSNQQLAVERQILLQQIYEYPWLLQENDLEHTTDVSSPITELIVPLHNPDFYQLCPLTNSSSFVVSSELHIRQATPPRTPSVM